MRLHSSLQHENVVKLYAAFQEGDRVVMVQEYVDGGDLFGLLNRYGGRLSERIAVQMVLDPFMRVLQVRQEEEGLGSVLLGCVCAPCLFKHAAAAAVTRNFKHTTLTQEHKHTKTTTQTQQPTSTCTRATSSPRTSSSPRATAA